MTSFITKVHKKAAGLQNQQTTLKYFIDTSHIPTGCSAICINSNTLKGEGFKIGDSQGRVLLKLKNHSYYYGFVQSAAANDTNAIFIFHDGTCYQGEIRNGVFDGRGKLIQYCLDFVEKIFEYDGEWREGKPHGEGSEVIQNSITYTGQFVNGKKEGKGTMVYKDNTRYEGEFKNNEIEGFGVYKTNAHQWTGTWKKGYLEGEGEQISFGQEDEEEPDSISGNSTYKGGFKCGQKNGMGTYTWGTEFSEYRGHFSNGQLDGQGRIKIGQAEYVGTWSKGMQVNLNAASSIQFKRVSKQASIKSLRINIPQS